jgi:hypothetical protein
MFAFRAGTPGVEAFEFHDDASVRPMTKDKPGQRGADGKQQVEKDEGHADAGAPAAERPYCVHSNMVSDPAGAVNYRQNRG